MEGWKTEKFKKLIDYKSGYTWSKEQELITEEPNSIRVLTVSNIQEKLDLTSELYLAGVSEQDRIKKQVSKDWSIAVSSNGNRNRIGNAIFIDSDTNYLFASFLTAFKPFDEADISPYYFYLWLSSSFVQRKITSVAEGTTGLGNLSVRFLRNMDITFPTDKAEQTAIAKILSTVDEAIRSTRETISKLERVKKSLMQNLLSGKMKPDGTLRPAAEFYEDEKMGLVPRGWRVKKVGEIAERKTDVIDPLKTKDVYDYIGLEHIAPNEFSRIGKGLSNETQALKVIFDKGDLLYGKLRPYLNKVWIADISGVGSTEFIVLKQNDYTYYLYLNMQMKRFLDFTQSMTAGTQHPRVSWRDIQNYSIIVPENNEMNAIQNVIMSIENKISNNKEKITSLELLKKSLMQQLLTGKVRVK